MTGDAEMKGSYSGKTRVEPVPKGSRWALKVPLSFSAMKAAMLRPRIR
jgi:hypothetical protein